MSSGLVYTYRGSWCSEGMNTTWESSWHGIGTSGSFRWDGAADLRAQAVKSAGGFISDCEDLAIETTVPGQAPGGHAAQIADFIDCLETGRVPETVCSDNIKSLAMVFSAIKSAETGKVVPVRWSA
jgi:predicted dehydrogenase